MCNTAQVQKCYFSQRYGQVFQGSQFNDTANASRFPWSKLNAPACTLTSVCSARFVLFLHLSSCISSDLPNCAFAPSFSYIFRTLCTSLLIRVRVFTSISFLISSINSKVLVPDSSRHLTFGVPLESMVQERSTLEKPGTIVRNYPCFRLALCLMLLVHSFTSGCTQSRSPKCVDGPSDRQHIFEFCLRCVR